MELPAVRWRMPAYGAVKVNVHGFYTEQPFPNGNRSGIGVVIRTHRGRIIRLYAGSLRIDDHRINEHYAMLEGLIIGYLDGCEVVELETDNVVAAHEWSNSMIDGVVPEHAYVVQQLNQRRADENLTLTVRAIDEDSNTLARYLARHGAENWTRTVIINRMFGRINEIWSHDMGLGPVDEQFLPVYEDDLNAVIVNEHDQVQEAQIIMDDP